MKSDRHTLLYDCEKFPFVLKGLRSASIKEERVLVSINNKEVGAFNAIEVFERGPDLKKYPQTIADIISNAYFRLTYQKSNGTSATFGTSVVGAPSFRTDDHRFHFVPHITTATVDVGDPHRLKTVITGNYGNAASMTSTRVYDTEAGVHQTAMTLEIIFTVLEDIRIDESRKGIDSFRFFSISSMFSTSECYDGNLICSKNENQTKTLDLGTLSARGAHLLEPHQVTSEFALIKQAGSIGALNHPGSPDSPSIKVSVTESSFPRRS